MSAYEEHNRDLEHHHRQADYTFPMEGLLLDPADPYAFRIILNQPYPQLRFIMAMAFTSPLAHEAVERYGRELARHPVGCGAFMMTSYKPNLAKPEPKRNLCSGLLMLPRVRRHCMYDVYNATLRAPDIWYSFVLRPHCFARYPSRHLLSQRHGRSYLRSRDVLLDRLSALCGASRSPSVCASM